MNLKHGLRDFVWNSLSFTGLYKSLKYWYGGMGTILTLHRVVDQQSPLQINRDIEVTVLHLENLLKKLKQKGFLFVTMSEVANLLSMGSQIKRPFIAMTIDDGYLDSFTHALPLFKKYDVPFTLYVATDFPNQKANIWWYGLQNFLMSKEEIKLDVLREKLEVRSLEQKNRAMNRLVEFIFSASKEEFLELQKELHWNTEYFQKICAKYCIDWQQLKEMSQEKGVTIGAHTVTHPRLSKLTVEEAIREITLSKQMLEHNLQLPVEHFCYPYGDLNSWGQREVDVCKNLNFRTATTTCIGNIFPIHRERMMSLPRVQVVQNAKVNQLQEDMAGFTLLKRHQLSPYG